MRVRVNGQKLEVADRLSLSRLLSDLSLPGSGEGVFLNGRRAGADEWERIWLSDGDVVETAPLICGG